MALSPAERDRRWRVAHPERHAARQRRWLANNPGKAYEVTKRYRMNNPEKFKRSHKNERLKRTYGITIDQYDRMLEAQKGVCKICKRPPKKMPLHVDHSHQSGRVRGLLCFPCNSRLIGRWREDQAWLFEKAAIYLASKFDGRKI